MVDSNTTAQDVGLKVVVVPFTSIKLALKVVLAVVVDALEAVDFLDVASGRGGT